MADSASHHYSEGWPLGNREIVRTLGAWLANGRPRRSQALSMSQVAFDEMRWECRGSVRDPAGGCVPAGLRGGTLYGIDVKSET